MQVTLFISSLIAILAIAVYFVHRAYLDHKIFEGARESMDLIVEHLDGIEMEIGNVAQALICTDPDPDAGTPDYIDCDFAEGEEDDHEV